MIPLKGPTVEFFVAGIPKSMSVGKTIRWKTKDGSRQGSHQKRENTDWASLVGTIGRTHAPVKPFAGPIHLMLEFLMPRPKSAKKASYPLKRPDIDNMIHKLTDQFNGVMWVDDSQIVVLIANKNFVWADDSPGLRITIEEIQ